MGCGASRSRSNVIRPQRGTTEAMRQAERVQEVAAVEPLALRGCVFQDARLRITGRTKLGLAQAVTLTMPDLDIQVRHICSVARCQQRGPETN